jgi:hypothetical protein
MIDMGIFEEQDASPGESHRILILAEVSPGHYSAYRNWLTILDSRKERLQGMSDVHSLQSVAYTTGHLIWHGFLNSRPINKHASSNCKNGQATVWL